MFLKRKCRNFFTNDVSTLVIFSCCLITIVIYYVSDPFNSQEEVRTSSSDQVATGRARQKHLRQQIVKLGPTGQGGGAMYQLDEYEEM